MCQPYIEMLPHSLIYVYKGRFVDQKKIESYSSDRINFSYIGGRISHQIYRLALPLLSPNCFPHRINHGFSYVMSTLLYLSGL